MTVSTQPDGSQHLEERAFEMLTDAVEALDQGFALCDADMRFLLANSRYTTLMFPDGPTPIPGVHMREIGHKLGESGNFVIAEDMSVDEWAESIVRNVDKYAKNIEMERTDGRLFLASSHSTGLGGYLITISDVTEQRRAERAEREADMLLHKIVEACPANFLVSRVDDGKIIYCPPASRERFGEIDSTLSFFLKPEDRTTYLNALLPSGTLDDFPVRFRRRDGSIMDGLTSARVTDYKGEDVIVSSTRDVTEQLAMQAELERQREAAHQNEKLSALGELLAGVAHELNNPLSIVVGYALMLQDKIDDPIQKRRIERIGQAAERCAKIVKTFLAMARQRPARLEQCSVNDVVRIALDVAGYGLRSAGVEITLDLDPDLPSVAADSDQMAQVFTNLIANAEQALADRGESGSLVLRSFLDGATGEVVVEVNDNGGGMPKGVQSRIFEPFFTTKDIGSGTGVGLAFCHRVVDAHGGRLTVKSARGAGTSIFVRLKPGAPPAEIKPEVPAAAKTQTARSVLIVDDEAEVTNLMRDILEEQGYEVATRNDAKSALALLASRRQFDAIISDIKMPGLAGEAFLERVKANDPGHAGRFAFVTGDTMSSGVAEFLENAGVPHLEKPIAPAELIELVGRLCTQTQGSAP